MTRRSRRARARTLARKVRGVDISTLRAAWWTARSVRKLRVDLRHSGLAAVLDPPPPLPAASVRGVTATSHWLRATCLERSLLLQKWLFIHGSSHTLVIGVPAPGEHAFIAHAWLEGHDDTDDGASYAQLVRLEPR